MRSQKVLVGVTVLNVALVVAAWFGLVGVPASGAQTSGAGVLEASGFGLVNDDGTVVGQLYVGDDGSGQIRLRDANGVVRVKLGAGTDGSGLILFQGGEPEPGVQAVVSEDGTKLVLQFSEQKRTLKP
jgi:hypothetical protein